MDRVYTIKKTIFADNFLFEVVECGGQTGVRCRTYLTDDQLMGTWLYQYADTKYCGLFRTCLYRRFGNDIGLHKFESIRWVSPLDEFDLKTGLQLSYNDVTAKIDTKRNKIRKFFKRLQKYNLSNAYKLL